MSDRDEIFGRRWPPGPFDNDLIHFNRMFVGAVAFAITAGVATVLAVAYQSGELGRIAFVTGGVLLIASTVYLMGWMVLRMPIKIKRWLDR